jgi:tetratricopeptide (TPR) repeat protein
LENQGSNRSRYRAAITNLAEAHLALGQYIYWIDNDYDRALQEFDTSLRLSPNTRS